MEEAVTAIKINHLKPTMKTLPSFRALEITSGETVLMVKVDGEFSLLSYSQEGACTINLWGKMRTGLPALNEFTDAMRKTSLERVEMLCELYAVEDGRPLKLPDFLHIIKGGGDLSKIRIGIFDLLTVNGQAVRENYVWKVGEVERWLNGCNLCHVLPHIQPATTQDVENFWNYHVGELGYEGLVARSNDEIWKVKPISELDAVIVALNKRELFFDKQVTSFRVALMDEDGFFVEIGDVASGINHDLRGALWKLMDFKVGEDERMVWVKPLVVCTVQYTDIFRNSRNKMYLYREGEGYTEIGTTQLARLRHPRLIAFRPDKQVTPTDLRTEQIPEA